MLSVRILPPDEWDKLQATDPFAVERPGSPEDWRVIVVERQDADGTATIVGTTSLFTAVHWDCWWVEPESRGKTAVFSLLLQASLALLVDGAIGTVYTGVEDSAVELQELLRRFGFVPAPGRLYVLPVEAARLSMAPLASGAEG